jgi:class 3 adenylate cyclase
MNKAILQQRLATLASYPELNSRAVKKLGDMLPEAKQLELVRINPMRFAQLYDIEPADSVDLFIHAAKVGIFDFTWSLLCPSCGILLTMGDAIMASFSDPQSAVRAAIEMMNKITTLNTRLDADGHRLDLKIGLHEGPALAVNADDRLDYFGQTVNIAARVQALAQAGEIWITEPVLRTEGVRSLLNSSEYRDEEHLVSLKGIGQSTIVYQCCRVG